MLAEHLEGRLPRPVDDVSQWGDKDTAVPPALVERRRAEKKARRDRERGKGDDDAEGEH